MRHLDELLAAKRAALGSFNDHGQSSMQLDDDHQHHHAPPPPPPTSGTNAEYHRDDDNNARTQHLATAHEGEQRVAVEVRE